MGLNWGKGLTYAGGGMADIADNVHKREAAKLADDRARQLEMLRASNTMKRDEIGFQHDKSMQDERMKAQAANEASRREHAAGVEADRRTWEEGRVNSNMTLNGQILTKAELKAWKANKDNDPSQLKTISDHAREELFQNVDAEFKAKTQAENLQIAEQYKVMKPKLGDMTLDQYTQKIRMNQLMAKNTNFSQDNYIELWKAAGTSWADADQDAWIADAGGNVKQARLNYISSAVDGAAEGYASTVADTTQGQIAKGVLAEEYNANIDKVKVLAPTDPQGAYTLFLNANKAEDTPEALAEFNRNMVEEGLPEYTPGLIDQPEAPPEPKKQLGAEGTTKSFLKSIFAPGVGGQDPLNLNR
jgi:hypothetical protein